MTNVTPINPHRRAIAEGSESGQLTSAHRCTIARIQELAIDISQNTDQYVNVEYAGHVHTLDVSITPFAHCTPGNYQETWAKRVRLPPSYFDNDRSLKMLGEIAAHLETLLPKPPAGGAA